MRNVAAKTVWLALTGVIVVASVVGIARHERQPRSGSVREIHVPRAAQPIVIDGETGDEAWQNVARTGAFRTLDGKSDTKPYSDARFTSKDGMLYVLLYAADEDIRATDAFWVKLGEHAFEVSPTGKPKPDEGIRVGHDTDGTLEDPSDYDEEWAVELEVPLTWFPSGPIRVELGRCDTPKDGVKACSHWPSEDAVLVLDNR